MELFVKAPADTAARNVSVEVKPRRIRVAVRGVVLLEGPLGGEVRAADLGDWEWELQTNEGGDAEGAKVIAITLAKRCAPCVAMS